MIEVDKKNRLALDIALHIPMPSFKIRFTREQSDIVDNQPLTHNCKKENKLEKEELKAEAKEAEILEKEAKNAG